MEILRSDINPASRIDEIREFVDQKLLSILDLQIGYLNLDNLVRNIERENSAQSRCSHCGVSQPTEKSLNNREKIRTIINHP